ncbi:MAG: DUF1972 domain-containing protein [Chitinophagales bacterium]|nr:DUF1972 domain-containing protein [Chitinophagales bacterium]MDW8427577.1 DUF1972 domain-containing protein [Chitinophagales bacterium]
MKIAILGTRGVPSGYSGYETFAEELGVRLVQRGHQVTVYAHRTMFPPEKRVAEYRGIRLKYLPALKGKNTSQFSHSFFSTFSVIFSDADVVLFCNAANGPWGLLLRLFGKRCCINVDGLEWLRPKWSWLGKKYFYFGAWCATKFFHVVITDAKGMQDYYKKEFNCDTVDIAYGADLKYAENPDAVRALGLEPMNYYLIASRLVPDNNAEIIIKGFQLSQSQRILAIAGGTVYKNPYEERLRHIADPQRVRFLGHIDNAELIKELHANAYAYLHGHEFGGTNPALLKGLAYGNCILALDTVFNREVLDEGKYGLLFKKDPADLAEKIRMIENDPALAQSFRERSRNRILERYTWEHITDQYESVFRRLSRSPKFG